MVNAAVGTSICIHQPPLAAETEQNPTVSTALDSPGHVTWTCPGEGYGRVAAGAVESPAGFKVTRLRIHTSSMGPLVSSPAYKCNESKVLIIRDTKVPLNPQAGFLWIM